MIKVKISKKAGLIKQIIIKGHAEYDDYGKDIVCASVSSIVITSVNAILKINNENLFYEEKDGYILIDILNRDEITNLLIKNMLDLLVELEKQYPKNIKIY